ncbi:Protein of unknown function (DUF4012) [Curtobacterium sp. 9128]|nr:Protein of unknown function (DUF4012) [Curtobacterium sp. 9128]
MSDLPESRRATRPRRSRPRYVLWSVLALILLLLLAVAWVGVRGVMAKNALETSVSKVDSLKTELSSGDATGAERTATELEQSAAHARSLTGDPVWRAAEAVPFFGTNLSAVRQVSVIVDNVAKDAVRPVAGVVGDVDVDAFKPTNGKVDLAPIVKAQPAVAKATTTLAAASRDADRIDTSGTLSAVTDAVNRLRASLSSVSTQADTANRAVALAPSMLGDGGAKHFLVLFQNNAELRAGGGIPGAVAELTVDDGAISLGRQASTSDFAIADQPVLPLATDTQGLYGGITGEYIQDVTLTPRFETSAQLAREMWKQKYGETVDGVLAIDPVTLGYILKATGPVQLATGDTLTSDNAVQLLLSDAYAKYPDPTVQDAFFASAASAVFSKVSEGGFDPKAFIAALGTGVDEGRVRLWSANADEQEQLAGTAVSGDLPRSDKDTQRFGVYLNDATGAKMDYYLDKTVGLGSQVCRKDGRPTWVVEVTLKNTAPADAATSLPEYVTGGGEYGVTPGAIRTNVAVYAPTSGVYVQASQDGKVASPQTATDGKYPVAQFQTLLSPGESTTLKVSFLGPASAARTPVDVTSTPGINVNDTKHVAIDCEDPVG